MLSVIKFLLKGSAWYYYAIWNTVRYRYNAIQYNMIQHISIALTETEYELEFEYMKDTQYLALTGELWGVFREDFGENWPGYDGTALYIGCFP